MNTFVDLKTRGERIGWFYAKKVDPAIRKFFYAVILILVIILSLTLVIGKMTDNAIKAQQLKNLIVYHNELGFQPVYNH